MQENEFEKQVKEMMEGFRLTPSDTAWENISRKLKKERPRKLPFIFLLAVGVIIAVGIGFYLTKENAQKPAIAANSNNNATGAEKNNPTLKDSNNSSSVQKDADVKNNTALSRGSKTDNFQPANPTNSEKASLKLSTTSIRENRNKNLPVHDNTSIEQQPVLPKPTVGSLKENIIPDAGKPVGKEMASAETKDNVADAVKENVATGSTLGKNNAVPDSIVSAQNEKDSEAAKQVKKTADSKYTLPKWQWGVNASYGESNAVTNLANTKEAGPQYLSLPVNNGGGVVYHNEYVYKPSATYSFGIDVQRKVLKNAVLGSGLSFTHISTKADISGKVDSTTRSSNFSGDLINGYFPPGVSEVYTNTYNFIELPLYFQQDFLQRKKFSFSYNAGFSLRQLLSSQSLIYNEADNIYFSKNDMLRKTQFQLSAGLNFKFNTGKTTSIYVGPQFSYSLSNMLKNDAYGNFHFMTYGVKAGLLLHKK